MPSTAHRLFVSHSHLDNEFGMKLTQDLRSVLTDEDAVFYDVMGGLLGGDSWWNRIVEELTTRNVFLLILSPDAMNSRWVLKELDIAINEGKLILPLTYRPCSIRADLKTIQIISFLAPKPYEEAFQEVLMALHLQVKMPVIPKKPADTGQQNDSAIWLIQQIESAFAEHDWPDVIRKAEYLMKHMPASMTSVVYRWQGVALVEEGEEVQAQEAFQAALALVSNRQERLMLLNDYTVLLVRQQQWAKVLQRAKEALRLVPYDPAWQAMEQQAQKQLTPHIMPDQKQEQIKEEGHSFVPSNTKEQLQQREYTQQSIAQNAPTITLNTVNIQPTSAQLPTQPKPTIISSVDELTTWLTGITNNADKRQTGQQASASVLNTVPIVTDAVLASTATLPENIRVQVVQSMRDIQRYINHGLLTPATEECLHVIDIAPQYLDVHQILCEIYVRQGKVEQAISKYAILIDTYIVNGHVDDAITTYRRILELDPNNLTYRMRLIQLLTTHGNKEDLQRERTLAAEVYLRLGYIDRALSELEKALQENPTSVPTRLNYALVLRELGRTQQAVAEYRRVLQVDPRNITALIPNSLEVLHDIVGFCMQLGKSEEASQYQEIIARHYFDTHQVKEAVAALLQLITIDRSNFEAYDLLGQTYQSVGEYEQASRVYRNLAKVNPDNPIARERLAMLQGLRAQHI